MSCGPNLRVCSHEQGNKETEGVTRKSKGKECVTAPTTGKSAVRTIGVQENLCVDSLNRRRDLSSPIIRPAKNQHKRQFTFCNKKMRAQHKTPLSSAGKPPTPFSCPSSTTTQRSCPPLVPATLDRNHQRCPHR